MTDKLPAILDQLESGEIDVEQVTNHLDDIGDHIEQMTEDTRTGNMVYAQAHVLDRAVRLLRELYEEQDEKGDREAEMMAVAIILDKEADETVM